MMESRAAERQARRPVRARTLTIVRTNRRDRESAVFAGAGTPGQRQPDRLASRGFLPSSDVRGMEGSTIRRFLIIALTVATALAHMSFFIADPRGGVVYLLNGLGFLVLLGALYLRPTFLRPVQRTVRPAFIGYTALTIILYVVVSLLFHEWALPLGPIIKIVELALIGLLWSEGRES